MLLSSIQRIINNPTEIEVQWLYDNLLEGRVFHRYFINDLDQAEYDSIVRICERDWQSVVIEEYPLDPTEESIVRVKRTIDWLAISELWIEAEEELWWTSILQGSCATFS